MRTRTSLLLHFFHVCVLGHHWQSLCVGTVLNRIIEKFGGVRMLRKFWDQNGDYFQNKKCLFYWHLRILSRLSGTVSHWCKKKSVTPEWRQSPGVCVSRTRLSRQGQTVEFWIQLPRSQCLLHSFRALFVMWFTRASMELFGEDTH